MMRSTVRRRGGGVQRAEDQVARLRGLDGDRDRLEVAHLADQDDVGVLAQRRAQRVLEATSVCSPTCALVDRHFLFWCTNSIGSSIVMMWSVRLRLMWSISAASVVRLARAGGPGHEHQALREVAELQDLAGERPISSAVMILLGIDAEHAADALAVREDVARGSAPARAIS